MKTTHTRAIQLSSIVASTAIVFACGGPQKVDSAAPPAASASAASTMPMPSANPSSASPAAAPSVAPTASASPAANPTPLIITIEPRSGSKLKGTAKFEAVSGGVQVALDVTGAVAGKHGAHIHQSADCSAKDGKSAGDHFNPDAHEHGLPPTDHRHLGDLGNLEVSKDGTGHLEITIPGANLTPGDKMSFLDRGIIIHEKVDNGGQPTGNAGNRIGCGEIKR
jgi:Cu-Zn family superoxide dismutase